jgi:2',3'-cyclic-nucleotide 2'-phosphodiesterase (5'-nucleotidase family)/Ca2+-binding RTX toxin-like protein
VRGTVAEFIPGGASTNNLSTTQPVGPFTLTVNSSGNALPDAVILGTGGRLAPTENIAYDGFATYDPASKGIDFYESLEAMRVRAINPTAVAGVNNFGEIWTVVESAAGVLHATNLNARGGVTVQGGSGGTLTGTNTGPGSDFNPERLQIDADTQLTPGGTPTVNTGDRLNSITGVIGYGFGNYELIPTEAITVAAASTLAAEVTTISGFASRLTVGNYNVLNLDPNETDGDTDIANGRFAAIATQIVANMKAPDIIALQEIQDNSGSQNNGVTSASVTLQTLVDAITAAGGPTYQFVDNTFIGNNTNGGQGGGNIRNAFLFNPARVNLVSGSVATISAAGQQTDGSNPFFASRLPLVADFSFNGNTVTIINNHFASKGGSSPLYGQLQPSINGGADQRLAQANAVASYVTTRVGAGQPNVMVVGDLNEFSFEESLAPLFSAGLTTLVGTLPQAEQYTYVFDGNAQQLDHFLTTASLTTGAAVDVVHMNAEFAENATRASDHDGIVASFELAPPRFTLQLLHFSDGEAGLLASQTAPNLAALVDRFEDTFVNSITLAGGDNFLPGPFLAAGTDPALLSLVPGNANPGRVDISIHNAIGVQASAIGNHEFDLGSNVFQAAITPGGGYAGALFPYISANLDFSGDLALNPRFTNTVGVGGLEEASSLNGRIAPSAVITENGEKIGLVGVTTQILEAISSPTGTEVRGFPTGPGANGEVDNMPLLAAQLQPVIDDLRNQGVNKIILLSHLQLLSNEQNLAPLLSGVDIIMAAGSNTRLSDGTPPLVTFPGHAATAAGTYPLVTAGADGKTTLIVNTDNEYTYLGRLIVDFDANGDIVLDSLTANAGINGAYASTSANVASAWGVAEADLATTAFATGTRGGAVKQLTDAVQSVITVKDGNVYGYTNVYLEGERGQVRTQETNLGNITADANAFVARQALGFTADTTAVVSIKNGGGIRAQIGTISPPDPVTGGVTKLPPETGGEVSQLDAENALRFNNRLMVFDTTAQGLLNILNGPTALAPNNGGFLQIGGVQFSYDPTRPVGSRVRDVALVNEDGKILSVLVDDGVVNPAAPTTIQVVMLNFSANGGDSYPVKANGENFRFILNDGTLSAPVDEGLNFTAAGVVPANAMGEITAFERFMRAEHGTPETAFNVADTPMALDTRIQNQAARADTALETSYLLVGTANADTLTSRGAADELRGLGGDDVLNGAGGVDLLTGGSGRDTFVVDGSGDTVTDMAGGPSGDRLDLNPLLAQLTGYLPGTDPFAGGFLRLFASGPDTLLQVDLDGAANGAAFANALRLANFNGSTLTPDNFMTPGIAPVFGGTYNGTAGNDVFAVTSPDNGPWRIDGQAGDDTLTGGLGDDVIIGGRGNDVMNGGAGNDTFRIGRSEGVDAIDGGAGVDTIQATTPNAVMTFSSIANVEVISSGIFSSAVIRGTSAANSFDFSGATLIGIGVIQGMSGADVIIGSAGDDVIDGGTGADTLSGGNGDDTFLAVRSNDPDSYDGGAGTDKILAIANGAQIRIRSITGVEEISSNGYSGVSVGGTTGADVLNFSGITLTGIASINGLSGDDRIVGTAGDDVISGGTGRDSLAGNGGVDIFRDRASNLNGDVIDDFRSGDALNITDFNPATTTLSFLSNTLTIDGDGAGGRRPITLQLLGGGFQTSGFQVASDGQGGALITYDTGSSGLSALVQALAALSETETAAFESNLTLRAVDSGSHPLVAAHAY